MRRLSVRMRALRRHVFAAATYLGPIARDGNVADRPSLAKLRGMGLELTLMIDRLSAAIPLAEAEEAEQRASKLLDEEAQP